MFAARATLAAEDRAFRPAVARARVLHAHPRLYPLPYLAEGTAGCAPSEPVKVF